MLLDMIPNGKFNKKKYGWSRDGRFFHLNFHNQSDYDDKRRFWWFLKITHLSLKPIVTQYGGGSMLCKNPIVFTMKEFPQI